MTDKQKEKIIGKVFTLYDGRAKIGDCFDASVLVCADSEKEAWEYSDDFDNYDAIWYESDLVDVGDKYPHAVNHKPRPDIGRGILL